jgi:ATP-dependent DNA ligase
VGWLPLPGDQDGSDVRLYSKSGANYSNKLPSMRKAIAELPTNPAILDGELCLIEPGVAQTSGAS